MNRTIFTLTLLILILSLGLIVGITLFLQSARTSASQVSDTQTPITDLIAQISPVTVSITSMLDDGSMTTTRAGTGIIVRSDGVILTNKHLISEGYIYSVELHDGVKISAKVIKIHPTLDLALLSLIADKPLSLPVGIFINSQTHVQTGQRVIALGNTLGLYPGSVNEGIISGLNRTVSFGGINMEGLLQTNIPMAVGNSGGPLVNLDGEIIGINTGIVGGNSQIGWALPLTQEEINTFLQK